MYQFTALQWVQIIAAATIPTIFIAITISRMSLRKSVRWKQAKMATMASLVPALIIFGIQGLLTQWMALGALVLIVLLALLMNLGND